jgi:O-antigen ligase
MIGFLLFAFAASIPLTDLSRYYLGSGSVAELLLAVLLLVLPLTFVKSEFRLPIGLALLYFVLVLAVWSWTMAVYREPQYWAPLQALVRQAEYFAVALVISQVANDVQRRLALMWGLVLGCSMALLITAVHWFAGPDSTLFLGWGPPGAEGYTEETFRAWGPFGNPLPLVSFLSAFLGIFLVLAMRETRPRRRGIWIGFLAATMLVLVMTGSRSALFVMVIPILYGLRFLSFRGMIRAASISVFLLIPIAFTNVAGVAISRLAELGGDDFSVVQRLMVFKSALTMMGDHPLLGVGADNFPKAYYPDYLEQGASLDPSTFTPENMFLLAGAENGILAMLLFASALFFIVWQGFRLSERLGSHEDRLFSEALALALLCFTATSLIHSSSDAASRMLLFTMLGFLLSMQGSWNSDQRKAHRSAALQISHEGRARL